MPVILSKADERLTYTPDREGFANFPPELREAIAVWQTECTAHYAALQRLWNEALSDQRIPLPDELATPLTVPPLLLDAAGRIADFDTADVTYTYKRLPGNTRARIIHEHTLNGITDYFSARYAMGAAALLDWHNVLDDHGGQVPFSKALIPYLPGAHVQQIGVLSDVGAPTDFLPHWLGSLNGSSSSPGTTAAPVASA